MDILCCIGTFKKKRTVLVRTLCFRIVSVIAGEFLDIFHSFVCLKRNEKLTENKY
jgi:hypothetical protein